MLDFHLLPYDGMLEARFDESYLVILEADPGEGKGFYVDGYINQKVIERVLTKNIYEALDKANEIYQAELTKSET